jgi:hypothetical protein
MEVTISDTVSNLSEEATSMPKTIEQSSSPGLDGLVQEKIPPLANDLTSIDVKSVNVGAESKTSTSALGQGDDIGKETNIKLMVY